MDGSRPASTGNPAATSWRPDFGRLWTAQTIAVFGGEITGVAIPLTAVALLGASPLQMGVLAAASTLPNLLFPFHFGVLADRVASRWSLLAWSNLARMGLYALIPLAWLGGMLSTGLLIAVAFAAGTAGVCFRIGWSSYLPSIVPAENLVEANSKLRTSMTLSGLAGVGLAGVLVQLFGGPMAVAINAASFGVSTVFLAMMRNRGERRPSPEQSRQKMRQEVADGLRYMMAEPRMRAIAGSAANLNLFSSVVLALYVLYVSRHLGISPSVIGLLFVVWGIGAVGGAMFASRLGRRHGEGRTIVGASVVFSLVMFAYPVAGHLPMWLAVTVLAAANMVFGCAIFMFDVHTAALRQRATPSDLQGRAAATMTFVTQGVKPIGALLGGVLGEVAGVRGALWIAAVGALTTVLWTYFSPLRTAAPGPVAGKTAPRPVDGATEEVGHQDAVLRDSGAQ